MESEKGEIWHAGDTHLNRSAASYARLKWPCPGGDGVPGSPRYREYGDLTVEQAKRLKELEKENLRFRRAVSDLTLDKLILKEAAEGNF
jgi:hypothetical protein